MNGVQCCFEVIPPSGTAEVVSGERVTHKCVFNTPAFSSDGDCPSPHVLEIGSVDRVISVRCRSGALVDSLEITTAAGRVLRAGGGGGGDDCQVTSTVSYIICGLLYLADTLLTVYTALQIEVPEDRALGGFFGGECALAVLLALCSVLTVHPSSSYLCCCCWCCYCFRYWWASP